MIRHSELPANTNIIVLSSYRVGSSAFCDNIAKKLRLVNHDEWFHPAYQRETLLPVDQGKKWLIKIQPDQFSRLGVQDILKDSFIIGIRRRDIIAQITSFYIGHMTGLWHNLDNKIGSYEVPLDQFHLENQIRYILDMNNLYHRLANKHSRVSYVYEDIKQDLVDNKFQIYHKPSNYKIIYQWIRDWVASADPS